MGLFVFAVVADVFADVTATVDAAFAAAVVAVAIAAFVSGVVAAADGSRGWSAAAVMVDSDSTIASAASPCLAGVVSAPFAENLYGVFVFADDVWGILVEPPEVLGTNKGCAGCVVRVWS